MKRQLLFVCLIFPFLVAADDDYMSMDDAKAFASRFYDTIDETVKSGLAPTGDVLKLFG